MKINFYLRPSRSELKPIKMYIHLNGKRDYIHTGHSCREKDWDYSKQQVKPAGKNSVPINKKIKEMEELAYDSVSGVNERLIDIEFIKDKFNELYHIQTRKQMSVQQEFIKLYEEFLKESESRINTRGNVLSDGMIRHYKSFLNFMIEFQTEEKYILKLSNIDSAFYAKFRTYCIQKRGITPTTFGGKIKKLKTFLYWCEDRDLPLSNKFKNFEIPQKYSDAEPLTGKEIIKLWNKEPHENLDKFLALVSTGMRISDYNRIMTNMKKYIKKTSEGDALVFQAQKTGKTCIVPMHDDLYFRPVYLFKKYKGSMPKISGQFLNRWLEDLSDRIKVSSKTGRKTMASIKHFEQGLEAQYVMRQGGWATENEFKKYLGVNPGTIIKATKEKSTHLKVS